MLIGRAGFRCLVSLGVKRRRVSACVDTGMMAGLANACLNVVPNCVGCVSSGVSEVPQQGSGDEVHQANQETGQEYKRESISHSTYSSFECVPFASNREPLFALL